MTFGSLFAGIEGFGLGFERAGMKPAWQCEINAQCRSVLARHWPEVQRHDDVTTFNATIAVRPDIICGGFPCQDLSVAGRRAGLAGERSGLWYEFERIIGEFSPAWVCIENVPGLLSSQNGWDVGIIFRALGELGYGWAYRVLDAQWFGVAQRRRRVFIVGRLGDVRSAAQVLFESDCLPWDSAPSREAGTRAAYCVGASTGGVSAKEQQCDFVIGTLNSHSKEHGHCMSSQQAAECGQLVPITFDWQKGNDKDNPRPSTMNIAEDQSNTLGNTRVPAVAYAIQERASSQKDSAGPQGSGFREGVAFTLEARHHVQSVVFDERQVTSKLNRSNPQPGDPCHTLHSDAPRLAGRMGVRRLMPIECERLQGFPDNWTRYTGDGAELSDSARYRMLGNAVCVNVANWIGKRIMQAQLKPSRQRGS